MLDICTTNVDFPSHKNKHKIKKKVKLKKKKWRNPKKKVNMPVSTPEKVFAGACIELR